MIIQLTSEERELVISLLDGAIRDTREEIYRTENFEFKETLRAKKNRMEDLLRRFSTEGLPAQQNIQYS